MDIKEKLEELEDQVSVIKDLELRKIAFERLLSSLTRERKKQVSQVSKSSSLKQKKKLTKVKKVSNDIKQKSHINLTEEDITKIKEYFGGQEYKSGKNLIFKICNYIRTKLNIAEFTSGDVTKIYDYLISLRIKVVALKHIHQAMLDLSSKSYKRMWLEYKGNGVFSVSRVGIIYWQEIENEA